MEDSHVFIKTQALNLGLAMPAMFTRDSKCLVVVVASKAQCMQAEDEILTV